MVTKRKVIRDKSICPLCGESSKMYFGHNFWCVRCNEAEILDYSKWQLIGNAKKIKLGLIRQGRG